MDKKSLVRAYAVLVLTFFLWGSVYVGGRFLSDGMPAALVACLRCVIASVPLMIMARAHSDVKIERDDWKYFICVGILGYFLTIFLIQVGISLTGASMAALLNSCTPVGVTIVAAIYLKEKITPTKVACVILAVAGTVIISAGATGEGQALGIIVIVFSIVVWSIASVFIRKLTAKYPPIMVTAYGMTIGLVFHIPAGIISVIQAGGQTGLSVKNAVVLLYLALFGTAMAQFTWSKSLAKLPASTCSLYYPLQPMFAALMGVLLLKEELSPTFFIGLLLISGDVVLSTLETRRLAQEK